MTQEAASADFYSACLQVILIAWLVLAVETRTFRSAGRIMQVLAVIYAIASMAAIFMCVSALDDPGDVGEGGGTFIGSVTIGMAFGAVFSLVYQAFVKESD